MPLQVSQTHLENDFYRDPDKELERANLSVTAIHRVLDKMGAPEGNGAESTIVKIKGSGLNI